MEATANQLLQGIVPATRIKECTVCWELNKKAMFLLTTESSVQKTERSHGQKGMNHLTLFLLFGWAYCVSPFGLLFKVSSFLFVLIKFHGANARIAWWSPGSGTSQLGFVPACIIKKFLHCSSPKITGRATAYGNGADLQYYQG